MKAKTAMKKTSKVGRSVFNWGAVSLAARSPKTRAMLANEFESRGNLVDACTAVEDVLEFVKGKAARVERERIRDVRRIGEGISA